MESEQLSSVYLPSTKQQTEKVVEESLLYGQKHDSRVALCALQISVQTEIDSEKLHGNTLNAVNTSTLMPFSLCMVRLHMTCFWYLYFFFQYRWHPLITGRADDHSDAVPAVGKQHTELYFDLEKP